LECEHLIIIATNTIITVVKITRTVAAIARPIMAPFGKVLLDEGLMTTVCMQLLQYLQIYKHTLDVLAHLQTDDSLLMRSEELHQHPGRYIV